MMVYNNFPTDLDVINFLTGLQLWNSSFTNLVSGYCDTAINKFQSLTGRIPFISETTPSSSYYDPSGSYSRQMNYPWRGGSRVLELETGYTDISYVGLGSTIDNPAGNSMDLQRALRFRPYNYLNLGVPIEDIEFLFLNWGIPKSIVVVGTRGYSSTVPADVWNAILGESAYLFLPVVAAYISGLAGGASELRKADSLIRYGDNSSVNDGKVLWTGPLSGIANQWHMLFQQMVNRYCVIRMGL